MTAMPVTHLSPSGLATWRQCPRKWWHRYVDEWPDYPPSEEMLRGTIVHAAVEALFPVGPVRPQTVADMDYHLSVAYDQADKTPITSDPAEFYETCRASLHSAVERLSRLDEVLLVEAELRAWGASGLEFYGFVDMVARKDALVFVIDLKTGSPPKPHTPWYEDQIMGKLIQPALYFAVLAEQGWEVNAYGLLFAPHDSPSQLLLGPPNPHGESEVAAAMWDEAVLAIDRQIRSESPPEARPSALCGWCPYVDRCPSGEAVVRERWRLNKSVGPAREALGL